jgi:hypothetical protein
MKHNQQLLNFRIAVGLMIPALLWVPVMQAAELVRWEDLPRKISSRPLSTQYRIVTKRGDSHVGFDPVFSPSDVRFRESSSPIPREDVAEIRIHPVREPWWELLFFIAEAPIGAELVGLDPFLAIVLEPVAVAAAIAAAPIILPIEGVKRLLPDRVLKIAP